MVAVGGYGQQEDFLEAVIPEHVKAHEAVMEFYLRYAEPEMLSQVERSRQLKTYVGVQLIFKAMAVDEIPNDKGRE